MIARVVSLSLLIVMAVNAANISDFEQRLTDNPQDPHAYHDYALWLFEQDNPIYYNKSLELMQHACRLKPELQWMFQLGCYACRYGAFEQSIDAYTQILEKYPGQIPVQYNLGYTYKCWEKIPQAIALYRKVLEKKPDYDAAHLGLAFALISSGQYKEGWQEHEWNLKHQGKYAPELRALIKNNAVAGKKILLRPEGGLGDSIHFIRYVQQLKNMGAHTIVAIQPQLIPLFSRCPYIDELVEVKNSLPLHIDAMATLMSLAPLFAPEEHEILQNIPYLFPDPDRVSYWHEQLQTNPDFKIGICWQPSVYNDISRLPIARRGLPLKHFFDLGKLANVTLYSLQRVEALDQLHEVPHDVNLIHFDESFDKEHGAFIDTAAVMQELDLIITADTATAHLAGALGRPVWLLLPYSTDWRWLINRTDSPWYPTMRIFKQPQPFDWESVMKLVYETFKKEKYKKK